MRMLGVSPPPLLAKNQVRAKGIDGRNKESWERKVKNEWLMEEGRPGREMNGWHREKERENRVAQQAAKETFMLIEVVNFTIIRNLLKLFFLSVHFSLLSSRFCSLLSFLLSCQRFLVSGGVGGEVRCGGLRSRSLVSISRGPASRVNELALLSDCKRLISCSRDKSFLVWDLQVRSEWKACSVGVRMCVCLHQSVGLDVGQKLSYVGFAGGRDGGLSEPERQSAACLLVCPMSDCVCVCMYVCVCVWGLQAFGSGILLLPHWILSSSVWIFCSVFSSFFLHLFLSFFLLLFSFSSISSSSSSPPPPHHHPYHPHPHSLPEWKAFRRCAHSANGEHDWTRCQQRWKCGGVGRSRQENDVWSRLSLGTHSLSFFHWIFFTFLCLPIHFFLHSTFLSLLFLSLFSFLVFFSSISPLQMVGFAWSESSALYWSHSHGGSGLRRSMIEKMRRSRDAERKMRNSSKKKRKGELYAVIVCSFHFILPRPLHSPPSLPSLSSSPPPLSVIEWRSYVGDGWIRRCCQSVGFQLGTKTL